MKFIKIPKSSTLAILSLVIIILLIAIKYVTTHPKTVYKDRNVTIELPSKIIYKAPINTVLVLTIEDLRQDLLRYKAISERQRKLILFNIQSTAKEYHIPTLALYAIIATESSFNPISKGKLITVKGKRTRGLGLGNVVYEWHPDLVANHILETKSDLYNIPINIKATGYIYAKYRQKPLKPGTMSKDESAQRRYYGGNLKSYSEKIKHKISEIMFKKIYK